MSHIRVTSAGFPIGMSLVIESLGVRYGSTVALEDVAFAVEAPEMIGTIGRSGAGKSTLLRRINRLVEPSYGSIKFDSEDVPKLRVSALRSRRASAAMIFQRFNLADHHVAAIATLAGIAAGPGFAGNRRDIYDEVRLGGILVETQAETSDTMDGFAAYAFEKLGVPVKIFTATEFIGINNALFSGQIEVA